MGELIDMHMQLWRMWFSDPRAAAQLVRETELMLRGHNAKVFERSVQASAERLVGKAEALLAKAAQS